MRRTVLGVFVLVVVCAFSAAGQSVVETESSASVQQRDVLVSLMISADQIVSGVSTHIELLDTDGVVRAQSPTTNIRIQRGKRAAEFRIPLGDIASSDYNQDLAWYRLRYRVGEANGVIAMSQLLRDLFELRVFAIDQLLAGMNYRVRVRALNPLSGLPTDRVRIEAALKLSLKSDSGQKLDLRSAGETNRDGIATLDFVIPADTFLGDDDGQINIRGIKNGIVRDAEKDLRTTNGDTQFVMMIDKPIYQPEQTLNIRGILLKGFETKTVLSGTELELRVTDEDDVTLYQERAKTSEFGIASFAWRIPSNAKLGDYRIEIHIDGETIEADHIRISRYDLPNFVVEAKAAKPFYVKGENEAEVEVKANYLFGKPVAKGQVRIVEEKSREWDWENQKYEINEGQIKEGPTDPDGKFVTKFDLKGAHDDLDDLDGPKYRDVRFAAYFTDATTGKTEQRRFDIRVTREPIHVYLIGNTNGLNPALPITEYVSTFYADGSPAQCDVELKASIEDEDKFKTVGHLRTNQFGAGKITMMRPKMGDADDDDLDFGIIAKDKNGLRGTYSQTILFEDEDRLQITTDKAIYAPGEMMAVTVRSTIAEGTVYVDVATPSWTGIDSRLAQLHHGRGSLQIPYNDAFKGELTVAAIVEKSYDDFISASRGVIFPSRRGISVKASFDKTLYKPNEEAILDLGVTNPAGKALESALGVVVFDRAVEERARTDADFGGIWHGLSGWLGYGSSFGGINIKDINEIDLTKPITNEIQLVAEVILQDNYYRPAIFHSKSYDIDASTVFGDGISKQFVSVAAALKAAYEKGAFLHPVDQPTLEDILSSYRIDLDQYRDPWGVAYRATFSVDKTRDVLTVMSAGPDKQFDTNDDFAAFTDGFEYFTGMGRAIDTVVKNYSARTGEFIRDEKTLLAELGMSALMDRFGRPYRLDFEAEGRELIIKVRSAGPDGKIAAYEWAGDDFNVWTSRIDYFAGVERRMADAETSVKKIPLNEADFRATLADRGIDFGRLRDGFGNELYLTVERGSRYWDKVTIETVQKYGDPKRTERTVTKPVTQEVITFTIRSRGKDGSKGTHDDFTLTQFSHVLSERSKDDQAPVPVFKQIAFYGSTGSIAGGIKDPAGAVIPMATITATNETTQISRTATSDQNGSYLIANLAVGSYSVKASMTGFRDSFVSNVPVVADKTTQIDIRLDVGASAVTVDVCAGASAIDTASTAVSTNISSQTTELLPKGVNFSSVLKLRPGGTKQEDISTPRIREYFPETLVWQPELITDKNGRAKLKFKMADNITTWKMYMIASTKKGKIGVAEKEITAFQPFFVDLDPPKFLTEGDEIYLPSQVRNYTDKRQQVDVTMAKAEWFDLLGPDKQRLNVDAGGSENAVFGFEAASAIKDGKQRVTAIAATDSDAIEKPVTVRPNGEEIVRTDSRVFNGSNSFDVNFPANALPRTQKAELKIYPNLFSHVSESVKGLLERPYGCGEQTISSTYPNLMILKFVKEDSPIRKKAMNYLQKGYERLLGYQAASGGFTYWGGKDESDLALTGYAIRFLTDAQSQISVDKDVIARAQDWLIKQQRADGSWAKTYRWETAEDLGRTKLTTSYIARTLAMSKATDKAALDKALAYLESRNAEIDEPYALALFGLASLDAGNADRAGKVAKQLERMSINEDGAVYWKLETNTPFYGWGTPGRIETTALVLQLLIRDAQASGQTDASRKALIAKATLFLLKNKDRYGVWYSTQTTINVLDAFIAALAENKTNESQAVQVTVNGEPIENLTLPPDKIDPVTIDLTGKLTPLNNRVEVRGADTASLMAQVVATYYIDWHDSESAKRTENQSRALKLDYKCDKSAAAIMEEINCTVEAERIGFRGYGMLLAEIGTPPGADVSRESLENAITSDWSISRYDILPDRIVVYMWSRAGGTKFNFKFKPRYGVDAQTPASVVYDYYNPEAKAIEMPLRFVVK